MELATSSSTPARVPGRRRRVFIDFSLVDFRTRVTGIPRVAYAYLEAGYKLQRELNIEVVPVYVRDGQLIDARPLLIQSNLRRFKANPGLASFAGLFKSLSWFLLHGLRLAFVTAITPIFAILSFLFTFGFFDFWKGHLESGFRKLYVKLKDGINNRLMGRRKYDEGDVLFMPAYWHDTPPGFYKRLRRNGLVICPLVHDILPITHAEHYESPWRDQFKIFVSEVLRNSDHVYYISEFTRGAVHEVNEKDFHLRLPPSTVIHHGHDFASHMGDVQKAHSRAVADIVTRERPYFLMVGSIEPKKNHLKVIEEFERLWLEGVQANLVLVGRAGWKDKEIRRTLMSNPHLHANLVWLDGCDDNDLTLLYRRATAVIQASEAEGFGLPIIEALSMGTPVLANDIPVFREVGGSECTFFAMQKQGDLAEKVKPMLRAGPKPVSQFKWPTWEERARFLFTDIYTHPSLQPTQSPSNNDSGAKAASA